MKYLLLLLTFNVACFINENKSRKNTLRIINSGVYSFHPNSEIRREVIGLANIEMWLLFISSFMNDSKELVFDHLSLFETSNSDPKVIQALAKTKDSIIEVIRSTHRKLCSSEYSYDLSNALSRLSELKAKKEQEINSIKQNGLQDEKVLSKEIDRLSLLLKKIDELEKFNELILNKMKDSIDQFEFIELNRKRVSLDNIGSFFNILDKFIQISIMPKYIKLSKTILMGKDVRPLLKNIIKEKKSDILNFLKDIFNAIDKYTLRSNDKLVFNIDQEIPDDIVTQINREDISKYIEDCLKNIAALKIDFNKEYAAFKNNIDFLKK